MVWCALIALWFFIGAIVALFTCRFIYIMNRRWDEAIEAKRKLRMIDKTHIFPGVIIALSIGAAIVCACQGDWRRAVYWTAAAVLNVAVTI